MWPNVRMLMSSRFFSASSVAFTHPPRRHQDESELKQIDIVTRLSQAYAGTIDVSTGTAAS